MLNKISFFSGMKPVTCLLEIIAPQSVYKIKNFDVVLESFNVPSSTVTTKEDLLLNFIHQIGTNI